MNDYNFGNFLCQLREEKGFTQAEIAKELGVTPAAVSKWENGSSKPRVEILFRLAELLDVRTEELIAGHRIASEYLDPAAVKEIREQYEYLRKVESYNTTGTKFRRVLAWLIDWNLIGGAVILLLFVVSACFESIGQGDSVFVVLLMLLIMLMYPIGVILRDFLFGSRSVGKRIMGLVILDKATGLPAKAGKRILRNLFLVVYQVDVIVMLVTGATLGDRAANTVVVSKKELQPSADDSASDIATINSYEKPKTINIKKIILIVAGAFVLFVAFVLVVTLISLSGKKDTQEYQVSYQYLVESEAFRELNAEESKIWMNQYSRTITIPGDGSPETGTAKIGFMVGFRFFEVVCHRENDVWQVCEECTKFD